MTPGPAPAKAGGERLRTLYFARMPESGKHAEGATRKRGRAYPPGPARYRRSRLRQSLPLRRRGAPPTTGPSWRALSPEARGGRLLARLRAPPHSLRPCRRSPLVRDIPPCPAPRPARRRQGDPGAALSPRQGRQQPRRAQRLSSANSLSSASTVRRMRYRDLSDRRLAIGSGVVEAANKILVTQRMKRSGMRWRIHGGQAVLDRPRPHRQSGRFDRAWNALMGKADTPVKRQHPHRQRRQAGRVKPEPQASDIIAMPDSRPIACIVPLARAKPQ